jgi:hypothetical protein
MLNRMMEGRKEKKTEKKRKSGQSITINVVVVEKGEKRKTWSSQLVG